MRLRSAADSVAFRAAAAFLAIAERSALVSELARAFPPNLPRATAFGFFFAFISRIMRDATLDVKEETDKMARTSLASAEFTALRSFIALASSPTSP